MSLPSSQTFKTWAQHCLQEQHLAVFLCSVGPTSIHLLPSQLCDRLYLSTPCCIPYYLLLFTNSVGSTHGLPECHKAILNLPALHHDFEPSLCDSHVFIIRRDLRDCLRQPLLAMNEERNAQIRNNHKDGLFGSYVGSINTRTYISCRSLLSRLVICAWFMCVKLLYWSDWRTSLEGGIIFTSSFSYFPAIPKD